MTQSAPDVRLVAVGDLQLGDSPTCVGFGFRSRVPGELLGAGLARFASAMGRWDVGFANLETPLSDLGRDDRSRRSRQLRGAPGYADVLRSAGFTVLNVANNHALEHGPDAFLDSVSRVQGLGFDVCGRQGVGEWGTQPVTRVMGGLELGFLAYSLRRADDRWGVRPHAQATTGEQVLADVRRLRPDVDCVVVSLHWGEEFAEVPSAAEVALAHAIVDAGATVLLGHHPHVARPVERYRGAVIAYSLGNFVGDMIWYPPHRWGLVVDCRLTRRGVGDVRVCRSYVEASYLPRAEPAEAVPVAASVRGLSEEDYIRLSRSTVRAQRRSLYLYTLRNAWRFDPRVLVEMGLTTIRGRVSRLAAGERDRIWG